MRINRIGSIDIDMEMAALGFFPKTEPPRIAEAMEHIKKTEECCGDNWMPTKEQDDRFARVVEKAIAMSLDRSLEDFRETEGI